MQDNPLLFITRNITNLRIVALVAIIWFTLFFNLERLDLNGEPIINFTNIAYLMVVMIGFGILAFPNLGKIDFVNSVAFVLVIEQALYILDGTRVHQLDRMVADFIVVSVTLLVMRQVSHYLVNTENAFNNYIMTSETSHIMPFDTALRRAAEEIQHLKRLNANLALIYARVYSDDAYLAASRHNGEVVDQHLAQSFYARYLQVQLGRYVMGITYSTDIVFEYGYGIAVCLPEADHEEAQKFIHQLFGFIKSDERLTLWTGVAYFPEDANDVDDLLDIARNNMEVHKNETEIADDISRHGDVSVSITDRLRIQDQSGWVGKLAYQSPTSRAIYRPVKRLMDIAAASVILTALSPLFAVVTVLIIIDDGLPVFFKQNRVGLGGKYFRMFKFRSMYKNAPPLQPTIVKLSNGEIRYDWPDKTSDDPRITRIGKFIRRASIDELPQLINVLKGDMSLIGPRPSSWGLEQHTLHQTARLTVKPGITGLWQVSARDSTNFDERLLWDLMYVEKMGLWLDILILVRTLGAVLRRSGN
ncbi:MAG: sugar transferase [Chloroflexi bacterium]|nr:sugar transferase [Chloroflexota bacterium]